MAVSVAEHFPATNPRPLDGGATWIGVMSPIDANATMSGSATIALDNFEDPSVDVVFDRIRELETGVTRDDMAWLAVPVEGGAFSAGRAGDLISGTLLRRYAGGSRRRVRARSDRRRVRSEAGTMIAYLSTLG